MELRKMSLKTELLGDKKVDYNLYGHLQAMSYFRDGKRFVYAAEATPSNLVKILTPKTELLGDKKVDYNLYGHLQAMSYFRDGKRFVYAAEATPSNLVKILTPDGADRPLLSLATVKRVMTLFKSPDIGLITEGKVEDLSGKLVKCYWLNEDADRPLLSLATVKRVMTLFKSPDIGLITEGKVEDLSGKLVKCYWLNEDENYFQLIRLDTLKFLCDVANSDVIKTYAYLLNKNFYFEDYSFSCKEIAEMLGYSYRTEVVSKVENILKSLKAFGLVEHADYYEKNYDGNPVPKKRLVYVSQTVNIK